MLFKINIFYLHLKIKIKRYIKYSQFNKLNNKVQLKLQE